MLPIILLLPIITVTIAANDKLPRIRNRRAERGFGIGSIYFVGGPMELPPSESRRGLGVIPGLKNSGQKKTDRTTATAGRGGDGSGQGSFQANRRKETNLIRPPPSPPPSPPSPPPSPPSPQSRPPSPPPSPSPPSPPPPLAPPPPQNQDAFKLKPTPINMMAAPVELDSTMIDSGNKPQLSVANNVASSQLAIQQEMLAVLKSIKTILEEIRNDARTDAKNDDDNDNGGGSKETEFKSK